MKIWIDISWIKQETYFYNFIIVLIKSLINIENKNTYIIFSKNYINIENSQKFENKIVKRNKCKLKDLILLNKVFNNCNLDLLISTSLFSPILFKWKNIFLINSLKQIIYPSKINSFLGKKYINNFLFKYNLKKSNLILTFDKDTKINLNENYNIKEDKISIINWSFNDIILPKQKLYDIKMKNNIKNDFLIYDWWIWSNKNIIRLIEAIKNINNKWINIDLLLLGNIYKLDNDINNLIKNNWYNNIHIITDIKSEEKYHYYKESIWIVYPSLYETFPFELVFTINSNTKLIASNIDSIKTIFWNKIDYINPLSNISIVKELINFINKNNTSIDYSKIKEKYNIKNTTNKLIEHINNI